MNLDHALRTGALVQAIDVLSHEQEVVAKPGLDRGQSAMARVWLHGLRLLAPKRIELPHQFGIAGEALGRSHVLDAMLFPQTVRVAERGKAALRGNPRAGQDEKAGVLEVEGDEGGRFTSTSFHFRPRNAASLCSQSATTPFRRP